MSDSCGNLMEAMEIMMDKLRKTEEEVNTTEVKQVKELLLKYDVILEGDVEEKDLVLRYETFYDQLNEFVSNKKKEIGGIEEITNSFSGFSNNNNFFMVINKKKENINEIIDCINRIIARIKELETTIYNNKIKELDNMKVVRYGNVKQSMKQVQIQQTNEEDDNEMDIINNSMDVLKQWSGKNTFNILFDSKFDGNGNNNVLHNRIMNKSNSYFITFDTNNNVFGGFVRVKIDKFNTVITDENSFVFSLCRNGNVKYNNYPIIPNNSNYTVCLNCSLQYDFLYTFGNDVYVKKIGDKKSWCGCSHYDYEDEQNTLINMTSKPKTNSEAKRIIVIEMN